MAELALVLTVEEAAEVLRIGRTAAYEAARRGELPVVRIGRSLRVPRHRLEALLGLENEDGPAEARAADEAEPRTGEVKSRPGGAQPEDCVVAERHGGARC